MLDSTRDLALQRAGFSTLNDFFNEKGLTAASADMALMPYLVGYELHRIHPGDTFTSIAAMHGTTPEAIRVANPGWQETQLQPGRLLVVPRPFPVVPHDRGLTSELLGYVIKGLEARYPALRAMTMGTTEYGRRIPLLRVGQGSRVVFYNAAHHANENITTPLVMGILEQYLSAGAFGNTLMDTDISALMEDTTLLLAPMVNPDGVDLVLGAVSDTERDNARAIAENYPEIPFPNGWKANLRGVDLNLNYPARWDEARKIKYELGFETPAPRDFVGPEPLSEQESRAMFDVTEAVSPALTIAWHTQGREIYWKFLDLEPEGARALGYQMADASGYRLSRIPYASSFAGYKDWFIQDFDRPGYTIEAGLGENPLPFSQLPEMLRDNLPIFLLGLTGGDPEFVPPRESAPEETMAVMPRRQMPRQMQPMQSWG